MAYVVRIQPAAQRQLEGVNPSDRQRLIHAIDGLASDPRPQGCKMLQGAGGSLRIRVGDWRIAYDVSDNPPEVTVFRIGNRREVYRKRFRSR